MAKIINISQNYIQEIVSDFEKYLATTKLSEGKVQYSRLIGNVNKKATIVFSKTAWIKTQSLIRGFSSEVGWHGLATRTGDCEYYIEDIVVYPQKVTGANVETDQEGYEKWLMGHDDEVFEKIRMQGHSHVNMGTSPSTVDRLLYDRILDQLTDKMFYIFMIWNKSGQKYINVYDMKENVLFETADVQIKIEGIDMSSFLDEAKSLVKETVISGKYIAGKNYNINYDYGYGYGDDYIYTQYQKQDQKPEIRKGKKKKEEV